MYNLPLLFTRAQNILIIRFDENKARISDLCEANVLVWRWRVENGCNLFRLQEAPR